MHDISHPPGSQTYTCAEHNITVYSVGDDDLFWAEVFRCEDLGHEVAVRILITPDHQPPKPMPILGRW